jgi:hypothetical protein
MYLEDWQKAENLYTEVCNKYRSVDGQEKHREVVRNSINDLVKFGLIKFGGQLAIVEITTVGSIFMLKVIIDMMKDPEDYSQTFRIFIFLGFTLLRLVSIFARSYYDLDVYNYFRYV